MCGDPSEAEGVCWTQSVDVGRLRQGESKNILIKKPPPPTCKDHDEQNLKKVYCFNRQRLICRDCSSGLVEKANMMVQVECEKEMRRVCQEKTNLMEFSVEGGATGKKSAEVGKFTRTNR